MNTTIRLYSFDFSEVRTYLWAGAFVICNLLLPQLCHLVPQGGIVFAPLSLVIMAGAYKLGWRVGLIAAVASPLVNHLIMGMPAWNMIPLMTMKLAVIAIVAGFVAQRYKSASLPLIAITVLMSLTLGGVGELMLTGGIQTTLNDLLLGWPGLLLQIGGTWLVANKLNA